MEVVRHEGVRKDDDSAELLDSAHQRRRAVLLLVVKEERPVRKPADQVVAPVLPYEPVFLMRALYHKPWDCINNAVSITLIPDFPG